MKIMNLSLSQSIAIEIVKTEKGPGEIVKTVLGGLLRGKPSQVMQAGKKRWFVLNGRKGQPIQKNRNCTETQGETQTPV